MTELKLSRKIKIWVLVAALLAVTFYADLRLELGVAAGVPYILPIWVVSYIGDRKAILGVAVVSMLLTLTVFAPVQTKIGTECCLDRLSCAFRDVNEDCSVIEGDHRL